MRELHLLRIGKLLFLTQVITTIFMTVGLLSQLMLSGMPPVLSILPLVANLGIFAVSVFVYLKYKGKDRYFVFVGIAFSALYALIMLTAGSGTVFPYMIPYLIVLVLALNVKLVNMAGTVFVVINVIRVMMTMATAAEPQNAIETCMVEAIITILVAVVTMRGVKLVNQFFMESTEEITSASEKSSSMAGKIVEVARAVEQETEKAKENVTQIYVQTQSGSQARRYVSS